MWGRAVLICLLIASIVLSIVAYVQSRRRGKRGKRGAPANPPATGPVLTYHLSISAFALSFITIPTSNVSGSSTTIASSYLAGRAPIYDENDLQVGTCSASFLNIQTPDGVFTDISNYLATDAGLIVTWFTPSTLINLALDSVINGMVTEAPVTVTT